MPPVETLAKNYHGSLKDSINNALGGTLTDALAEVIVDDFVLAQNRHYEVVDHHIYPDALDLVNRAHAAGLTQVVVSNRDHAKRLNASPRSIVERSELRGKITYVVCGDDSQHRKPKPEVIAHLLDSGVVNPNLTVVVGDQYVDALFARNLGAQAVLVSRNGKEPIHMDRLGNDWRTYTTIVSSLTELSVT